MNLDDALTEIAEFLDLDADALIAYAAEDTDIGGFDFDASKSRLPGGSLWEVEGKTLYALVRALDPNSAVELGVWHGGSSMHILSAQARNEFGVLDSVDFWEGSGTLVPTKYRRFWTQWFMEATAYLKLEPPGNSIDFVFEDCIHSEEEVYAIVSALKPKLRKGAVVVHHDSEHGDDGLKVKRGLERAGVNYRSWLISPSDCGLAIWRAE